MVGQIKDKVALVTGGAKGIGLACIKDLLKVGVGHISLLDLPSSGGEDVAVKLNAEFGKDKVIFIPVDVTKSDQLEAAIKKTLDTFEGLDIIINNAGVLTDKNWDFEIQVNVYGVVHGTLLGLKYMGKHKGGKGGTIVNVASILGLNPLHSGPIYAATKFFVIGLDRSLGHSYHFDKTGVRILTLCPGITDTILVAESSKKLLEHVEPKFSVDEFNAMPFQQVENVSQGLVYLLENGENGSIWVAEGNEPVYEVRIPDRLTFKVPRKDL